MVTEHVDAETLALFAEGKLSRAELRPVLEHVTTCPSCMRIAKIAGAQVGEEAPRRVWPYWLGVAAAIFAVMVAIPVVRRFRTTPTDRLIALAPHSARIVEPRLAGGFGWAPWRGTAREGDPAADAARLKLGGVAGELMERADANKTADAQHAAGVALLLAERPLDALPRLRDAAERSPDRPQAWSDLAAAQYAAASSTARASMYPEALAAADRALRIDRDFPEALFNRALVLERMGAKDAARAAWERYLAVDSKSSWASEAREHLQRLSSTTGETQFRSDLPLLERAAIDGDRQRVAELVTRYPQMSRLWAEGEFLGGWAEAKRQGASAEGAKRLAIARGVGVALEQRTGEAMVADAVRAIDRANENGSNALAEAHAIYRRGRIAYARQRPADAEPDLRRAATLFSGAGSPMAYVARHFAACTRYDQNDVVGARAELTSLLEEIDAHPEWTALGAQVRWQLSLCLMNDGDWGGALPLLRASESAFDRLGERNHLGFIRALLADALACEGRADESWNVRMQSFAMQSEESGHDYYLGVSFGSAARTSLRAGRLDAARSMLDLEIETDRRLKDDVLLTNALARAAVLSAALGDGSASRAAAESETIARRIGDAALRERALENAAFASGAVLLRAHPGDAREQLTRAIDGYRRSERAFFLPESYLLRARASRALGDIAGAADDLERGIAELERHRIHYSGTVIGTGVFDAGRALFHEAIRVSLQRGDAARALTYAERSRPQVASVAPTTVAELQTRLRNSGTAVLEIVALPDEAIAFGVTADALHVARTPIARDTLTELATRSVRGERHALAQLYETLVQPSEPALATSRRLIVVADPALDAVPFGALFDARSQRHLIERMPVALSLSALALRDGGPEYAARSLMVVSLPEGERGGSKGLPHVQEELDDVRRLYAQSFACATFAGMAVPPTDVLHIAGHTQVRTGSDEPMLGFAAAHGDAREWISWRRVAGRRFLSGTTVVLAACETLRRPDSQTFALSLGGGFLAAGASDVIGTLDAIGDQDAHRVFQAIHRRLAAGVDPADAVRSAQIDALSRNPSNQTAWFAVSVLTNRIRTVERAGGS
ncbi:MAG: CHAT domain-containing protein [Acidobacteria bacterium]|nr:CHAT domain-containing protein [Acidobacteriota bacterium]